MQFYAARTSILNQEVEKWVKLLVKGKICYRVRQVFICPKNLDHIMPYQSVCYYLRSTSDFFCVFISLPEPQNNNKKCWYVYMYVCQSHLFICPKNLDHIMSYRLPSVIFFDHAKIFPVVLLQGSYHVNIFGFNVSLNF